jgi:lysyl-tRNA synthetase class 2
VLAPDQLRQRSEFLLAVRHFFHSRGYLEVDTPALMPVLLPEAHIKPVAAGEWFLQTSPEQCMKRLLAGGSSRLFQICHCFRSGECGRLHQPEFTMLEWYSRDWGYCELMTECEEFIRALVRGLPDLGGRAGESALARQGRVISLDSPWERITIDRAFHLYAGISVRQALEEDRFEELLVGEIEPHLGWERPVFVYDYPVELASLARRRKDDESLAERFELYIAGIELANGFSELTDPDEQRHRFLEEMEKSRRYGSRSYDVLPEKFLADLAGLDRAAGIALGLDRLFMILLGCGQIEEVMCLSARDV